MLAYKNTKYYMRENTNLRWFSTFKTALNASIIFIQKKCNVNCKILLNFFSIIY